MLLWNEVVQDGTKSISKGVSRWKCDTRQFYLTPREKVWRNGHSSRSTRTWSKNEANRRNEGRSKNKTGSHAYHYLVLGSPRNILPLTPPHTAWCGRSRTCIKFKVFMNWNLPILENVLLFVNVVTHVKRLTVVSSSIYGNNKDISMVSKFFPPDFRVVTCVNFETSCSIRNTLHEL